MIKRLTTQFALFKKKQAPNNLKTLQIFLNVLITFQIQIRNCFKFIFRTPVFIFILLIKVNGRVSSIVSILL